MQKQFSHDAADLIQARLSKFTKLSIFSIKLLHANVQCGCNVKAKYHFNPSKTVLGIDQPVYALS